MALVGMAGWPSARASEAPALALAPLTGGRVLEVAIGLFAVVAVIALCAWILRRTLRNVAGCDGALRVVAGLSLGTRERVLLLQVGSRQLLLGVSPGRIQALYVLDEPLEPSAPAIRSGRDFAAQLSTVLARAPRGRRHEPKI